MTTWKILDLELNTPNGSFDSYVYANLKPIVLRGHHWCSLLYPASRDTHTIIAMNPDVFETRIVQYADGVFGTQVRLTRVCAVVRATQGYEPLVQDPAPVPPPSPGWFNQIASGALVDLAAMMGNSSWSTKSVSGSVDNFPTEGV